MTIRDALGALFWCFIIFGGGLALFNEGGSVEKENRLRSRMANWPKVTAKIEDAHVRYKRNYGTITATYTYKYNGLSYTSNNVGLYDSDEAVKLFRENLQFASRIDCFVNPTNPSEAYLFNNQTDDSSPTGYRIGGLAIMVLGVVIFYFTFIHGFFQRKIEGAKEKEKGSASVPTTSNVSRYQRANSYNLPQSSTPAPKKIRKNKASIEGLAKIINTYIIKLNCKDYNKFEKYKLEAIVWMFCISHLVIKEAYEEAAKKHNEFYSKRIHVDNIRLRSVSIACIAIIQHLGVSNLNLRELSKLYWNRLSIYSEKKKENHFTALFSLLLNENDGYIEPMNVDEEEIRKEKTNKITISAINKHSLSLCNSLVSDILKWMLNFFQSKGFNEVYDYSVSLFEAQAQWRTGLKDKKDGKVYVCCNRCSILSEVDELYELLCYDCQDKLNELAKKDTQSSSFGFIISSYCKHCGQGYDLWNAHSHHCGLCYSCFMGFSKNFARLRFNK